MGSKAVVCPPRLAPGSRVALVAPAGPLLERDDLARSLELCRWFGWEPVLGPNAHQRYGYLAGTDDQRLADLNAALRDPAVDAIWCIRGGYGVTRILDGVDFSPLTAKPKAVIGYSDVTALILASFCATGVVSFHAAMARAPMPAFTRDGFEAALLRAAPAGRLPRIAPPANILVPRAPRLLTLRGGVVEGPLLGGNLSLLAALQGTRHLPSFDGAILFIEDIGEDLYRIDRMLAHLRMTGLLERVAGVLIGQFTEMRRGTGEGALGFDEVMATYFEPLRVPVLSGVPIGHVDEQWTIPIGVRARLDASAGEVEVLDPAVC